MRHYILYTAILITLSLLMIFLMFSKYQSLSLLKKNIAKNKQVLSHQEEYLDSLTKASQRLKKYDEEMAKVESALPSSPSLPELLNLIQNESTQHNLSLKKIGSAISVPSEIGMTKATRLNFVVSGGYSDLKDFISDLENSARLIDIESISFSSPKEKEGLFTFSITIKVHSY